MASLMVGIVTVHADEDLTPQSRTSSQAVKTHLSQALLTMTYLTVPGDLRAPIDCAHTRFVGFPAIFFMHFTTPNVSNPLQGQIHATVIHRFISPLHNLSDCFGLRILKLVPPTAPVAQVLALCALIVADLAEGLEVPLLVNPLRLCYLGNDMIRRGLRAAFLLGDVLVVRIYS